MRTLSPCGRSVVHRSIDMALRSARARKRAPTRSLSNCGYVHGHVQVHEPHKLSVTVPKNVITLLARNPNIAPANLRMTSSQARRRVPFGPYVGRYRELEQTHAAYRYW